MSQPGLIEAYLYFNGNCLEAFEYYKTILNGELTSVMHVKELPAAEKEEMERMPGIKPEHVMHASLKVGDVTLMGSDNPFMNTQFGDSITLNWSHPEEAEVRRVWHAFASFGSEITMPLEPAFFAPLFGQLTDKFGINWQIMQWTGAETP